MSRIDEIKARWRHAFAVASPEGDWSREDRELVERLAGFIVRRRRGAAALMALEAGRPFNFLGSQLTFLAPFATLAFSAAEYDRFTRILERRRSVELLLEAIARCESEIDG